MVIKRICIIIAGLLVPLTSAGVSYGQQYVSQGAWAVGMVRGLGWEAKGIPVHPSYMDYFDLLAGRYTLQVDLKGPGAKQGAMPDTVTYMINVPHCGRYNLIATVNGAPILFTVDDEPTVSSQYSYGWNYEQMGNFILKRGMHRLSITRSKDSGIGAVYVSSYAVNAIQPAGGWVANKALDYGTEARTMAMSMDLTDALPVRSQVPFVIRSQQNIREFIFYTPSDPVISFDMTFAVPSKGYVMLDNAAVLDYDTGNAYPKQINLKPLSLPKAQHIAYLKVLSGAMPSSFIIKQRNDSPEAYVSLMRTKGFTMGLASQLVPLNIAQASLGQFIALSAPKQAPAVKLAQAPVTAELPSQKALKTYSESISPMQPFHAQQP